MVIFLLYMFLSYFFQIAMVCHSLFRRCGMHTSLITCLFGFSLHFVKKLFYFVFPKLWVLYFSVQIVFEELRSGTTSSACSVLHSLFTGRTGLAQRRTVWNIRWCVMLWRTSFVVEFLLYLCMRCRCSPVGSAFDLKIFRSRFEPARELTLLSLVFFFLWTL